MLARIYSAAIQGVDAIEVEVEVNVGGGDPEVVVVGLPDAAVRESKDRVITALTNSGFYHPRGRTTINLAPADIKKEGPSFDLPIAIGMAAVATEKTPAILKDAMFVGELALTGAIRRVKGALPIAIEARRTGRRILFVPEENAREAAVVEGIDVYGVRTLRDLWTFLETGAGMEPVREDIASLFARSTAYDSDFSDVRGQHHAKRAIEVAVSGGHNLLMIGPPGSGKSMLSKRIATIMPPLGLEEAIETTKIHSICGLLDSKNTFVGARPFRSPHHTVSDVGLLGGSANITPGEVSVAHHGVLFLDELPEFKRSTLEVMRQPLEDGRVTISRAAGSMTFPAEFMLVSAMNPCPCGFYGDPKRQCRCSTVQIDRYRRKISGPLLDRIDIHVEVPAVEYRDLTAGDPGEKSETIRERVIAARDLQRARFGVDKKGEGSNGNGNGSGGSTTSKVRCNARMTPRQIKQHCALDSASMDLIKMAMTELGLSARAYDRILKVSRTIADLAGDESIQSPHVMEAIQYRTLDRNLWQ